ncbi:MAG: HAD hydrolase family protein, partial [Planctomycetes bacterium]|nr:HAD hydrolase family protein [Planctomycetota bacterium]
MRPVRLVVTDVDGVLTDGRIGFTSDGAEIKYFHCRDGAGFSLWRRYGGLSAFLTGRGSSILMRRAQELQISKLVMNAHDKLPELHKICAELGVALSETAYLGDDWPDLACLRAAGLGVAVADAAAP